MGWARTPSAPNDALKQEAESASHVSMKLPVRVYGGYLVIVEGAIGNVHKLNFLVDRGACPSVVDQKIARERLARDQRPRS